jgi:hypothetical protein
MVVVVCEMNMVHRVLVCVHKVCDMCRNTAIR